MIQHELSVRPLSRQKFKPFGDIIETDGATEIVLINDGFVTRYHDLAKVDVSDVGGRPLINIFRVRPRPLPITIHMMERHPMASQAFMLLHKKQFVVVVAHPIDVVRPGNLSAFITD